jgi:hypothetical protein
MKDTIELCKAAGFPLMSFEGVTYVSPELERLVALVRADERAAPAANDEALKLALEALEAGEYYIDDLEAIVYASDDLGTHEDRAKMQEAITAIKQALAAPVQDSTCNETLRAQGKAYPRTCKKCGKGPCIALANAALDKKAENPRELGLDYEPAPGYCQQCKQYSIEEPLPAQPAPVQEPVAWRTYTGRGYYIIDLTFEEAQKNWPDRQHQPLYTTPPAAPDLQAELDATNRQVEILSDALAESRREVDALVALARADEREACANVVEAAKADEEDWDSNDWNQAVEFCASRIRARKDK